MLPIVLACENLDSSTSEGLIVQRWAQHLAKRGVPVSIDFRGADQVDKYLPQSVIEALQREVPFDSIRITYGCPSRYLIHRADALIQVGMHGADTTKWEPPYRNHFPADTVNLMDYFITFSPFSKDIITALGADEKKIVVITPGIDRDFCVQPNTNEAFVFLHMTNLSLRKGTYDVVRAFVKEFGNDDDYVLCLVGPGESECIKFIRKVQRHVSNIVLINEVIPHSKVQNVYANADAFVYPSRGDSFGISVFEAMACGLPIIATATNGYYDYLAGYILDVDYKLIDAEEHGYLGRWAKPDHAVLRLQMRDVTKMNPRMFQDVAPDIVQSFNWDAIFDKGVMPFLTAISEKVDKSVLQVEPKKDHHLEAKPKDEMVFVHNKKGWRNMDETTTRITVGIPTKDRPVELALLLQSLLFQTHQDFDILIINDCAYESNIENSTIQNLIQIHEDIGHEVTILKGAQKGPHVAGQRIFENAKTDLIFRVDDDVALRPDCISELLKVLQSAPYIGAVGPIYIEPKKEGRYIAETDISKLEKHGKVMTDGKGNVAVTCYLQVHMHEATDPIRVEHLYSGMLYRKSAMEDIGGYDLEYSVVGHHEESDITLRMTLNKWELYVVPTATAFHFHPMYGGIRETKGHWHEENHWKADIARFQQKFRGWPNCDFDNVSEHEVEEPQTKNENGPVTSIVIVTYEKTWELLARLLTQIDRNTASNYELVIVNNDENDLNATDVINLGEAKSIGEARNIGVRKSTGKYICFLDDDSAIQDHDQSNDWLQQLRTIFESEPDVGGVGPFFFESSEELGTPFLGAGCLFTSRKVWDHVGGFDPMFSNLPKGTWGYTDLDWGHRVSCAGFKLKFSGNSLPYVHVGPPTKPEFADRQDAMAKGKKYLLSKYGKA